MILAIKLLVELAVKQQPAMAWNTGAQQELSVPRIELSRQARFSHPRWHKVREPWHPPSLDKPCITPAVGLVRYARGYEPQGQ